VPGDEAPGPRALVDTLIPPETNILSEQLNRDFEQGGMEDEAGEEFASKIHHRPVGKDTVRNVAQHLGIEGHEAIVLRANRGELPGVEEWPQIDESIPIPLFPL